MTANSNHQLWLTKPTCDWFAASFTIPVMSHIEHGLSAGREAGRLALALTAVRQLQTRLSRGQPGADKADLSRLSHAVSHAVKAAMRLRKAVIETSVLDCSDSMAAMLAEALDAAAALVESAGGLSSATGPPPLIQILKAVKCTWELLLAVNTPSELRRRRQLAAARARSPGCQPDDHGCGAARTACVCR